MFTNYVEEGLILKFHPCVSLDYFVPFLPSDLGCKARIMSDSIIIVDYRLDCVHRTALELTLVSILLPRNDAIHLAFYIYLISSQREFVSSLIRYNSVEAKLLLFSSICKEI